jgi:hypothetical protein
MTVTILENLSKPGRALASRVFRGSRSSDQSKTIPIVEAPVGNKTTVANSTAEFKNQTLTISRGGKEGFADF